MASYTIETNSSVGVNWDRINDILGNYTPRTNTEGVQHTYNPTSNDDDTKTPIIKYLLIGVLAVVLLIKRR